MNLNRLNRYARITAAVMGVVVLALFVLVLTRAAIFGNTVSVGTPAPSPTPHYTQGIIPPLVGNLGPSARPLIGEHGDTSTEGETAYKKLGIHVGPAWNTVDPYNGSDQSFTYPISNSGSIREEIIIEVHGGDLPGVEGSTNTFQLDPDASCRVIVVLSPTKVGQTTTITFTAYDAAAQPVEGGRVRIIALDLTMTADLTDHFEGDPALNDSSEGTVCE
jgi:hypothetical protein